MEALAVLSLLVVLAGLPVLWWWLRRLSVAAVADVEATLGRDAITLLDRRARSLGLGSAGWKGLRGTGVLALTADTLLFRHWTPTVAWRIPRERITEVEAFRSHNGKSVVGRLVRVAFMTDDGGSDAIAFQVADTDRWLGELATPGKRT